MGCMGCMRCMGCMGCMGCGAAMTLGGATGESGTPHSLPQFEQNRALSGKGLPQKEQYMLANYRGAMCEKRVSEVRETRNEELRSRLFRRRAPNNYLVMFKESGS